MKFYSRVAGTILFSATLATMSQAGGVAYPDNWRGGPPLPPVNNTYYGTYGQAYVTPDNESWEQHVLVQPYVTYARPQTVYVEPTETYSTRSYVAYGAPNYVAPGYDPYYSPGQAPMYGAVQGPPQSHCIVSTLNGTQWQDGCAGVVHISPADAPFLRHKFSRYQSNTGYVQNLPTDEDYR